MSKLKFFIFLGVTTVSAIIVKCIQIAFLTNAQNGFFYNDFETLGHLLTALVVAATAICALFGSFIKDRELSPIPKSNALFGSAAFLLGISQITEIFTYKVNLAGVPNTLLFLRTASILGSGVVFCYVGIYCFIKKKCNFNYIPISVIAWILRLITTFISFSGMSNISDNLYDVLCISATLVFLLFHSKMLCGLYKSKNTTVIFTIGAVAFILCAVNVVPKILLPILSVKGFAHTHTDSPLVLLFMAFYILFYLLNISGNKAETR